MIMYVLMFASGIRLRYKNIDTQDGFRIPGKRHVGMWIVGSMGVLASIGTFMIGFIPPDNIKVGGAWHYDMLLLTGLVALSIPPVLMYLKARRSMVELPDEMVEEGLEKSV